MNRRAGADMPTRPIQLISIVAILLCGVGAVLPEDFFEDDVFVAGEGGYHTYRIPAAILTPKDVLLAFCEGRKKGTSDSGDIDLLLRRSLDGGATWLPRQVVWDDGPNTVGNPCPVIDRSNGTVWLPLTRNLGEDTEDRDPVGEGPGLARGLDHEERRRRSDVVEAGRDHEERQGAGLDLVRHGPGMRDPATDG